MITTITTKTKTSSNAFVQLTSRSVTVRLLSSLAKSREDESADTGHPRRDDARACMTWAPTRLRAPAASALRENALDAREVALRAVALLGAAMQHTGTCMSANRSGSTCSPATDVTGAESSITLPAASAKPPSYASTSG